MRIFSRLTILASGFTRRPRSRCRRSSSSTSSRDISRFPPITRSLARPQFRFLPGRCTVCTFVLSFFSSSPLPRFRCFYLRHAFRRYRAIHTHTHTTHPPTHPPIHPSRQGCRRGCTRVTELESKSRAIRFDGTRSIARSLDPPSERHWNRLNKKPRICWSGCNRNRRNRRARRTLRIPTGCHRCCKKSSPMIFLFGKQVRTRDHAPIHVVIL